MSPPPLFCECATTPSCGTRTRGKSQPANNACCRTNSTVAGASLAPTTVAKVHTSEPTTVEQVAAPDWLQLRSFLAALPPAGELGR